MTPEQQQKALEAALERATHRLVERGFATIHVDNTNTGKGTFVYTDDGIALSRLLKKCFDVPNVSPQILRREDIIPLVMLILTTEPVQHRS